MAAEPGPLLLLFPTPAFTGKPGTACYSNICYGSVTICVTYSMRQPDGPLLTPIVFYQHCPMLHRIGFSLTLTPCVTSGLAGTAGRRRLCAPASHARTGDRLDSTAVEQNEADLPQANFGFWVKC
jgi:hypothetical protein